MYATVTYSNFRAWMMYAMIIMPLILLLWRKVRRYKLGLKKG